MMHHTEFVKWDTVSSLINNITCDCWPSLLAKNMSYELKSHVSHAVT